MNRKNIIRIIVVVIIVLIGYLNIAPISYYLGHKFIEKIKYKKFEIPIPKNYYLVSILENRISYVGGILPSKYIPKYSSDSISTNSISLVGFKAKNFFSYDNNRFEKLYGFIYKNKSINIDFLYSKEIFEKFDFVYKKLENNGSKISKDRILCNDNNSCMSYDKYKNLRFIREDVNDEFYLFIIDMESFILKILVNSKPYEKPFSDDKSIIKVLDNINSEYIRLNNKIR